MEDGAGPILYTKLAPGDQAQDGPYIWALYREGRRVNTHLRGYAPTLAPDGQHFSFLRERVDAGGIQGELTQLRFGQVDSAS